MDVVEASSPNREPLTARQIIEAALPSIAQRGFRSATLGNVAEKLGVTRQAIYYYYPKKQDILVAIFEEFFDWLEAAVKTAEEAESDPARQFQVMFKAHLRTVAANPGHSAVFSKEFDSLPAERQQAIRERRREYNDRFVRAYAQGVSLNELRPMPPDIAVGLILGLANWTYWWYRPDSGLDLDELAELGAAIAFRGALVEPDAG